VDFAVQHSGKDNKDSDNTWDVYKGDMGGGKMDSYVGDRHIEHPAWQDMAGYV
jgi:hypothetical protein